MNLKRPGFEPTTFNLLFLPCEKTIKKIKIQIYSQILHSFNNNLSIGNPNPAMLPSPTLNTANPVFSHFIYNPVSDPFSHTQGYSSVVLESVGQRYTGPGGMYSEFVYVSSVANAKIIFVTIFVGEGSEKRMNIFVTFFSTNM